MFSLFIEAAMARLVTVLQKCLFAKRGGQIYRQTVAEAHIIADDLLLCIAFSKVGSAL